ncbi:MAG: four helix bundle protein [Lacipirellulaceae bacterium]
MSRNYQDLVVWQKSMDFVEEVYKTANSFPSDEKFGLCSQLRRCAVSIPSNIAEGQGRFSEADFRRFLSIAHGSLREAETQIMIACRLKYIERSQQDSLLSSASEVGRLLNGLKKSLEP